MTKLEILKRLLKEEKITIDEFIILSEDKSIYIHHYNTYPLLPSQTTSNPYVTF